MNGITVRSGQPGLIEMAHHVNYNQEIKGMQLFR